MASYVLSVREILAGEAVNNSVLPRKHRAFPFLAIERVDRGYLVNDNNNNNIIILDDN